MPIVLDTFDTVTVEWDAERGIVLRDGGAVIVLTPVAWANLVTWLQRHQDATARRLFDIAQA